MPTKFEEIYGIPEEPVEKEKTEESFVFPVESSETKEAIDKADKQINDSVRTFAKNLDKIKPGLTKDLLDVFEKSKNNPKFKGLSESGLWLHSLGKLYEINKIPSPLDNILNEMMQLLNDYTTLRNKSKTLEEMLRVCAYMDGGSDIHYSELGVSSEESNQNGDKNPTLKNSTFTPPPTSYKWGR